jgi:hypothetical protein
VTAEGRMAKIQEWQKFTKQTCQLAATDRPHPIIPFNAEKGHRARGYSKQYFALENLLEAKHFGVAKSDAD